MRLSARRRAPRARAREDRAGRSRADALCQRHRAVDAVGDAIQLRVPARGAEPPRRGAGMGGQDPAQEADDAGVRCAGGGAALGPQGGGAHQAASRRNRAAGRVTTSGGRVMNSIAAAPSFVTAAALLYLASQPAGAIQQARPLRIIAFGAHPDDAELKASGVAACGPRRAQGEVRRDDQRRRRALRDGWRAAGAAAAPKSPSARRSSASRPTCSTSTTASSRHRSSTARRWRASSASGRPTSSWDTVPTTITRITDTPAS